MRMDIPGLGAIAVLALAGCGTTSAKSAPTKAQFTARADAICGYEEKKLRRAAAFDHASIASFSEVPRLIRQAVAIHEAATAKLESLSQPVGEAATITRWLTARTVATTLERDTAEAPSGKDLTAARDVREELGRARAFVGDLSRRYGLQVCGASSEAP
jgi:hypothetical protein